MRVLYYYGGQQVDTGSPQALINLIELLDRDKFYPLFGVRLRAVNKVSKMARSEFPCPLAAFSP